MKKTIVIFVFCIAVIGVIISCRTIKDSSSGIEIPFMLEHGEIVVEAAINGKTARYAWSIASNTSVVKDIDPDWAVYLESDRFPELGELPRHYKIEEIIIGGVPVKANSVATDPDSSYDDNYLVPYGLNGRFGIDVFSGYWCEVSFSKNKIILHSKKPSYFEQSVKGIFDSKKMLTIPVTIEGKDYDYLFQNGENFDILSLPLSITEQKPENEYQRYLYRQKDSGETGEICWVRTRDFTVFGDTYKRNILMADPFLAGFIWYDYGKNTGALSWALLQNYDLLFDFTGIDYISTTDENFSLETQVYYAPRNLTEDRECLFLTEYPGGELGAFAFVDPSGVTLFLAEDSPLSGVGITPNTVITHIDGKPVSTMAEAGMTPFSYQTALTILDENEQEREIALEQLRP
jgi:hypothetical protein